VLKLAIAVVLAPLFNAASSKREDETAAADYRP
jgi:hypothetical protein